jgi:ABC-type glycerol-3-phosphate transport system permease component
MPKSIAPLLKHGIINVFVLLIILPVVKSIPDAYSGNIWPERFDWSHYGFVLTQIETLPRNLANSVVVTLATVLITTACAVLGGYALTHLRTPGGAWFGLFLVASLFFPTRILSLIALYEIQRNLGLLNTVGGLILPYVTLNLAVSILIMRGIFEQIPTELVDAARIDGCGTAATLVRVMLPLVLNGIVVVAIVNFVGAWGEYLLAATLTNDVANRTLPVVLASALGGMGQWAWPRIAAVYVIAIMPGIVFFALLQRFYLRGLMEGALKL